MYFDMCLVKPNYFYMYLSYKILQEVKKKLPSIHIKNTKTLSFLIHVILWYLVCNI